MGSNRNNRSATVEDTTPEVFETNEPEGGGVAPAKVSKPKVSIGEVTTVSGNQYDLPEPVSNDPITTAVRNATKGEWNHSRVTDSEDVIEALKRKLRSTAAKKDILVGMHVHPVVTRKENDPGFVVVHWHTQDRNFKTTAETPADTAE